MLRILNKLFKSFISLGFILTFLITHQAYACEKHKKKAEQEGAGTGTTQSQNEKQNSDENNLNRAKRDDQASLDKPLLLASVDKKETIAKISDTKEIAPAPIKEVTSESASVEAKLDKSAKADKADKAEKTVAEKSEKAQKSEQVAVSENSENGANNESNINVVEFVLANQVESREPKVVEAFSNQDERGFAFARLNVKNTSDVTFVWYRNGHEINRTTLPVHEAKRWRTFSSVKLRSGEWKVQLLANNQVLAEKTFTIE